MEEFFTNALKLLLTMVFLFLLGVLKVINSKVLFWINLCGEVFLAMGVAFMSGAIISSNILTDTTNFLILIVTGAFFLFLGAVLKTSGAILTKKQALR